MKRLNRGLILLALFLVGLTAIASYQFYRYKQDQHYFMGRIDSWFQTVKTLPFELAQAPKSEQVEAVKALEHWPEQTPESFFEQEASELQGAIEKLRSQDEQTWPQITIIRIREIKRTAADWTVSALVRIEREEKVVSFSYGREGRDRAEASDRPLLNTNYFKILTKKGKG